MWHRNLDLYKEIVHFEKNMESRKYNDYMNIVQLYIVCVFLKFWNKVKKQVTAINFSVYIKTWIFGLQFSYSM